jgi:hypothetical protein
MNDSAVSVKSKHSDGTGRWLLLIHQIPPKPDYYRVKVRRRLQRMGAVALKNSVYVLPSREDTVEDFRWLLREIVAEGGEATICEGQVIEGITPAELVALFLAERETEYAAVAAAAQSLDAKAKIPAEDPERRSQLEAELTQLRQRLDQIGAVDFFRAPARRGAERALNAVESRLRKAGARGNGTAQGGNAMRGKTWVTRRDVHIDRIASGWLIRRFIDPKARFKFTDAKTYQPRAGEVSFDMFEAEYTHEGDHCTFETLLQRAGLRDRALRAIGEIVHDIDCKDEKFGREEVPGIAALVRGLTRAYPDDNTRLERGAAAFDDLYASLR